MKELDGLNRMNKRNSYMNKGFAEMKIYFLFLLVIFPVSLNAQSVDSLITEAFKNNPQLKSLQFKIEAAGYKTESVDNLPAPDLGFEFQQIPITSIDLLSQPVSQNVSISQMFPLGGKINAMTNVERENINVEKSNFEIYKVSLKGQIKMSYFTIWEIERKIDVQTKNISLLSDLINSLEVSYSVNRVNQADLLTVKSEIASDKTQLIILENQKEAEIYRLNKLLGRKLDSRNVFILQESVEDSLKLPIEELNEILLNQNPQLSRMNRMIDMNKAMIDANNKELIPDLMVKGMVMRMPRGMLLTSKTDPMMINGEGKTEIMYSLMASISLPFVPWSINKIKFKSEEYYAGIGSIENEKNDMQREMTSKLKEAYVKYTTARSLVNLYSNDVLPLYKEAATSQVSAYQNNKTSISTVLDSYKMLLMQEMNFYMAKADVQMALAEIEMMVGTKFSK